MGYIIILFFILWGLENIYKPKLDFLKDKTILWYNKEVNNPDSKRKFYILWEKKRSTWSQ